MGRATKKKAPLLRRRFLEMERKRQKLLIHRRTVRSRRYRNWALQLEGNDRFRLQDDLLSLGSCGNAGSGACACCRSNGCAFTAAKDAAQNRADSCATANFRCRGLAASIA